MIICRHYISPLNTFIRKGKEQYPDPDPYLWLMDPDLDPGGPNTCGSCGSGYGSLTLFYSVYFCLFIFENMLLFLHCNPFFVPIPPPPLNPSIFPAHSNWWDFQIEWYPNKEGEGDSLLNRCCQVAEISTKKCFSAEILDIKFKISIYHQTSIAFFTFNVYCSCNFFQKAGKIVPGFTQNSLIASGSEILPKPGNSAQHMEYI